jgi:hypothetical protein
VIYWPTNTVIQPTYVSLPVIRIFSWAAVRSVGPSGGQHLVGFITARVVQIHECDQQVNQGQCFLFLIVWRTEVKIFEWSPCFLIWAVRCIVLGLPGGQRLVGFITTRVVQAVFFFGSLNFSYIKSLSVASMRVSGYFNRGKWPQFTINILNVAFIPIIFNQIAFLSATLAVYRH